MHLPPTTRRTLKEYAAFLLRAGSRGDDKSPVAREAGPPSAKQAARRKDAGRARSPDYFVFLQKDSRWAWQRWSAAAALVAASKGSFTNYRRCLADARRHGWKGSAVLVLQDSGVAAAC